jgi:putative hemolysin
MRLPISASNPRASSTKIVLGVASLPEEIREVQRLRFQVLASALGLSERADPDGLDEDDMDEWCDHLVVREMRTLRVIGSLRLAGPRAVDRHGRFPLERVFDLERLQHVRGRMAEAGCACIHPDFRGSGVLMMLWAGLSALMQRVGYDYLVSSASISLADGGYNATALYQRLSTTHLAPLEYRVSPRNPLVLHDCEGRYPPCVPLLVEGYLRAGAWVCGDPAWDADANSAEMFLLLPCAGSGRRQGKPTMA